jgi:DNA-binding transcriptional LysR family regulator
MESFNAQKHLKDSGRYSAYGSDCAVTRTIQDPEDALWTPLLDRQTRPLRPALAGTETYEFARPALSSIGDQNAAMMEDLRAIFAVTF